MQNRQLVRLMPLVHSLPSFILVLRDFTKSIKCILEGNSVCLAVRWPQRQRGEKGIYSVPGKLISLCMQWVSWSYLVAECKYVVFVCWCNQKSLVMFLVINQLSSKNIDKVMVMLADTVLIILSIFGFKKLMLKPFVSNSTFYHHLVGIKKATLFSLYKRFASLYLTPKTIGCLTPAR